MSKRIEIFGETKNLTEWSKDERCEVKYRTFSRKIANGCDPEKALKKFPSGPKRCETYNGKVDLSVGAIYGVYKIIDEPRFTSRFVKTKYGGTAHQKAWKVPVECTVCGYTTGVRLPVLKSFPKKCIHGGKKITWDKETKTAEEWAQDPRKATGVSHNLILGRIGRGWSAEAAITMPRQITALPVWMVKEIKANPENISMGARSRKYGISLSAVSRIVNGSRRKDVV